MSSSRVFSVISFLAVWLTASSVFGEEFSRQGFDGIEGDAGTLTEVAGRGQVLELPNGSAESSALRSLKLPLDQVRGRSVVVEIEVAAEQTSAKPNPWNGIKIMLHLKTPAGEEWPQKDMPVGTFGWTPISRVFQIPPDATEATLLLGLEKVLGTVRFSKLSIHTAAPFVSAPAAPKDQPIFKGHDLPRLRGAMVRPSMSEEDFEFFTGKLHGNLIRWQLLRWNVPGGPESDFTAYDKWLEEALVKTDQVLEWAKKRHVLIVLDLHSPPGSQASPGGYMSAEGPLFTNPAAQAHFIEVWKKMALRYKANTTIWGFDLVNEPVDKDTTPNCLNWQGLALAAGKAVREIDPSRTLIIEPPDWGGAGGFRYFNPVPLERVVYSFHMYSPIRYTHQGVFKKDESAVSYPGEIDGATWNREALEQSMKPARDFAEKYRVQLYVGEFSAIRWAPGAETYLADAISLFEKHGWDWSYHAFREWDGWDLEYTADKADKKPSATPTARLEAVEKYWKENRKIGE